MKGLIRLQMGLKAAAFVFALLLGGCTPATPPPPPTPTLAPTPEAVLTTDAPTPDQGATEDAARFTATVQAYQTETAGQKATERAAGTIAPGLAVLSPENITSIEHLESLQAGPLLGASFSPDGRYLIVLTAEKTLVYKASEGMLAADIPGDAFGRITFSASGERFAAGLQDGQIVVKSPDSAELVQVPNENAPILMTVFSPQENFVIAGSADGTILIADSDTGELITRMSPSDFGADESAALPLGFSPDGSLAAVFFANLSSLWVGNGESLLSGAPQGEWIPWLDHAGPVADARIAPDWQHIAWISRATLQIMDINGEEIGDAIQDTDWIQDLAFLPVQPTLMYASAKLSQDAAEGIVRAVDLTTGSLRYELSGPARVSRFSLAAGGVRAAAGFENGELLLFDPQTGAVLDRTNPSGVVVTSLAFNPSGSLLAALMDDGNLEIGPAGSGTAILLPDAAVYGIGFDAAGQRFIVVLDTGEIRLYGVRP